MASHNVTTQAIIDKHAAALGRNGTIDRCDLEALFVYYAQHIAPTVREFLANRTEPLGNAFVVALICAFAPLDCAWQKEDYYYYIVQARRIGVAPNHPIRVVNGYAVRFVQAHLDLAGRSILDDWNLASRLVSLALTPEQKLRQIKQEEEAQSTDKDGLTPQEQMLREAEYLELLAEQEEHAKEEEEELKRDKATREHARLYCRVECLRVLIEDRDFAEHVVGATAPCALLEEQLVLAAERYDEHTTMMRKNYPDLFAKEEQESAAEDEPQGPAVEAEDEHQDPA